MTKKTRRYFTDEQKAEAVNIVKQSDKSVSQVAKEMGLTESALRKWVKQSTITQSQSQTSVPEPGTILGLFAIGGLGLTLKSKGKLVEG